MKSRPFIKFTIPYIIVLIIPVALISVLIYGRVVNVLKDEVNNSTKNMLYQIRDVTDVRIREIVDLNTLISRNSKISPMISNIISNESKIYPEVYDCIKELDNYKDANSIIDHIFLCSRVNNVVVSDMSKGNFDSVFGEAYVFKDTTSKQLYEQLNNLKQNTIKPSTQVNYNNSIKNVISYMQPLPFNSINYKATLIITMKESMFHQLIQNVLREYSGSVYILDANNNILSSTTLGDAEADVEANAQEANRFIKMIGQDFPKTYSEVKKGWLISYVKSTTTGWSYVALIPSGQILKKVNDIRSLSMKIIFSALGIGLLLAFVFSHGSYSNIRKVTDTILSFKRNDSDGKYRNEWDVINQAISSFISENKSLQQRLTDQMPVLKNNFYMRLLKGDFSDKDTINSMKEFLKIRMEQQSYAVLILAIDNYSMFTGSHIEPTQGVIRIALCDAAEEICSEFSRGFAVEIDKGEIAVIIGLEQSQTDDLKLLKDKANKIRSYVAQNFDFTITIGISDIHDDILKIKNAYEEASTAIDYRITNGENTIICYYDGKNRINNRYYYSFKQENEIISYLRAGDFNLIKIMLDDIVKTVKCESVAPNIVKCICFEIVNTALKASSELEIDSTDIEQNLPNLVQQGTLDGVCREVCQFYLKVCEHIQKARSSKNNVLMRRTLDYLEKNYYNKSLSVELLADEFSISPSYMSRLFKEQVGDNFIDYLHNIRLIKAKELLAQPEITVAEIADRVGYNSIQNFTRVFKRYENITPTEFRLSEVNK